MNATAITLECIDGKDDHFKVDIADGEGLTLGKNTSGEGSGIEELREGSGFLVANNTNGLLQIDATGCNIPVKINGREVKTGVVRDVDVLIIGSSIWKTFLHQGPASVAGEKKSFTKTLSGFIGAEDLQDFKLSSIFSEVFKKHTLAETEEQLYTGTSKVSPAITEIETSWAKPWLFSRLILVAAVLTAVLIMAFNQFTNYKLVPNFIVIGTYIMPLATVIFFMELNAPRNISIFLLTFLLFLSGVVSLVVTILIGSPLEFIYKTFGAAGAPFIEEPAKILVVIFVLMKFGKYKWILNGLLVGAAVGAGFGAFESAGYAFEAMLQGNGVDVQSGVNSIVVRGMLAPFMHVIWTANAAAGLWMAKGDKEFEWSMLGSPKFLRVFLLSVALHFIWNSNFSLVAIPVFADIKYLILGVISWTIGFMLIQTGLKQLNVARKAEVDRLAAA